MPTYEYRCSSCQHEMEALQPITAKPLRKCPECGKNTLQRLIGTGVGVIFKGGGFYQTDYRSEGYKKSAEAEKKSAEPATTESKTEPAKAETKKEPAAVRQVETKAEKPRKTKYGRKSETT